MNGELITIPVDDETDSGPVSLELPNLGLQQMIANARAYPRDIKSVVANITTLATLDDETAAECLYALVRSSKHARKDGDKEGDRSGKAIEGPSIRLAEIAAQCYGNCFTDGRRVRIDKTDKVVICEGLFFDAQTNMGNRAMVSRRIADRHGRLYSDDMINVTTQAAISIAKRNAILGGIPRGIYRPAYVAARGIVSGGVAQLPKNRAKALAAFAAYGIVPKQILDVLGVASEGEIGLDHIATLRGMFAAIRNGEATVEEMFPAAPSAAVETDAAPRAQSEAAPRARHRVPWHRVPRPSRLRHSRRRSAAAAATGGVTRRAGVAKR
jgi:hypothetical protein